MVRIQLKGKSTKPDKTKRYTIPYYTQQQNEWELIGICLTMYRRPRRKLSFN